MEVLSILFGLIFWPTAIIGWIVFCRLSGIQKSTRNAVLCILVFLPLLAAYTMGRYMFLDEPLCFAAREGNIAKVRSLLAKGASANAEFEGISAIESAAGGGHLEIVRLLVSRGAKERNAVEVAKAEGHEAIVRFLKEARASR